MITTKEVASELGVDPWTVWNWRKNGRGPKYIRVGGQVRYRREDIEAFKRMGEEVNADSWEKKQ